MTRVGKRSANRMIALTASVATDRRTVVSGLAAFGVASVLAPPVWTKTDVDLDLATLESRHGGRIGVCAQSGNGRVRWRGGERFAYCSTFKLFLAAATLGRVQSGLEKIDRAIPIVGGDIVSHAPVTEPAVGSVLTVEQLCKATVEISDNPAANILIREMGGLDSWRAWYRSIGDEITRVDRLETDLNSALPGDPRDTTTPDQAVANLAVVLLGDLLSPGHRRQIEHWLINTPSGAGRIKAAVPAGYRVGHKTGTGSVGTTNDIGIVWPPSGSPILIAVYFTGATRASSEERDAVIAQATRLSLRGLNPL